VHDAAALLGVSKSTVYRQENGEVSADGSALERLRRLGQPRLPPGDFRFIDLLAGTSIFPCFPQFRAGLVARTRLEAACRDVRQRRQRPSRPALAGSGRFGLTFAVRITPGRG
jgi:hypothetical protein